MSLHPQPSTPVPPQTRQVAQAAFPRGNRYLQLRDTLGTLYDDALFADLFPQRGQAADAVRSRLDWKYLLGLELTDPGFDFSILSEFRQRLVAAKAEERLLTHLLVCCQDHKWLKAGGKQRTDSTHVLARVRDMNRLECVGETMRFTLNSLATLLPDWLARQLQPEWAARYGPRAEEYRLPHTKPLLYNQRAGIEGTLSQGVRGFGMRRSRYMGLAKTHLQHVFIATAMNLCRIVNWLNEVLLAQTRQVAFERLIPPART